MIAGMTAAIVSSLLITGCVVTQDPQQEEQPTLEDESRIWTDGLRRQLSNRKWRELSQRPLTAYVVMEGRLDYEGNFHFQEIKMSFPDNSRNEMARELSSKVTMTPFLADSHILPRAEVTALFFEDSSPQVAYVYGRQLERMGPSNVADFVSPVITHLYYKPMLITPDGGQMRLRGINSAPVEPEDILISPVSLEDPSSAPLLVFLHGMIGHPSDPAELLRPFAENEGIRIFLPRGSVAMHERPDGRMGYTWDPLTDPEKIIEKIHALPGDTPEHVYLAGFSAGASMSYLTGIERPDLFSGVIAFAGAVEAEFLSEDKLENASSKLPIWIIHGRQDKMVPIELGEYAFQLFQSWGFEVRITKTDTGHSFPADWADQIRMAMRRDITSD